MIYTRDLPPGHTAEALAATHQHVRDHLASVAAFNDDPEKYADQVTVKHVGFPDGSLRIVGELDEEPKAPYLLPGYDPDQAEGKGL